MDAESMESARKAGIAAGIAAAVIVAVALTAALASPPEDAREAELDRNPEASSITATDESGGDDTGAIPTAEPAIASSAMMTGRHGPNPLFLPG